MSVIIPGLLALVVAFGSGFAVVRLAAHEALDVPQARSLHITPTTRLGGLSVIAGLLAGLAFIGSENSVFIVMGAVLIVGAAGLLEDLRGIPIPIRLLAQVGAAGLAAWWLLSTDGEPVWFAILAFAWIILFVNEFNFMDGIHGIAGLQLAVAGVAWIIAGWASDAETFQQLGAIALAVSIGFLPFNFPRARMFMGDLGSYAAGCFLAMSAIIGISLGVHPVAVMAPLAVFIFDATWTLGRRALRGENVLQPHRSHFYQRMVLAGGSPARVTTFVTSFSAVVSAVGLAALIGDPTTIAAAIIAVGLVSGYGIVATRLATHPEANTESPSDNQDLAVGQTLERRII